MEQTPGYGVTPSSSGVTAPSTSRGGMPGYVPPWESPSTPQPLSLPPLTIRTLMYVGDRLSEAEIMAVGLPATPEVGKRGPPSGRLIHQCLTRKVGAQLGHLVTPLHHPPQALRGLPLTLQRASLTIGAKGGRRT